MTSTAVFDAIVAVIREGAGKGEFPGFLEALPITPHTRLEELGLDSLCKMSLLTALMDITDQYFPDELFEGRHTLGEIVAHAERAGTR